MSIRRLIVCLALGAASCAASLPSETTPEGLSFAATQAEPEPDPDIEANCRQQSDGSAEPSYGQAKREAESICRQVTECKVENFGVARLAVPEPGSACFPAFQACQCSQIRLHRLRQQAMRRQPQS